MKLLKKIASTELGGRYLNDRAFRGSIGIYQGMLINLIYAVFRGIIGIIYSSVFSLSAAAYYFSLGLLRSGLAYSYRRRKRRGGLRYERRCYLITAWLLLILNIPMGGVILLTVRSERANAYPGYTIYAFASYTFYMITVAIINIVKYRRLGSPILSAAKVLNFISALMSMLGLQNALIAEFSEGNEAYRRLMNTITGTGIYIIVILLAIGMIICAHRAVRRVSESRE